MSEVEVVDYANKVLTPEDVAVMIEELRNLMLDDEDLSKMRTDDAFLLRFLHRTRFHVYLAFNSVKKYYLYIVEEMDWIALDIMDNIKTLLNMNMRVMLPAVDKQGKKIFYMKTDTIDPSKIGIDELNKIESIWLESVLDDPKVQAKGICLLIDVSGFSWKLFNWITPTNIKKGVRKLDSITVKDATIYVVRSSIFIKTVVNIVWPLLPNRIKERIKFHYNDLEALYEDISPENLPKEYGGFLDVDFKTLNAELLSRDEEIRKKLEHYKIIASR